MSSINNSKIDNQKPNDTTSSPNNAKPLLVAGFPNDETKTTVVEMSATYSQKADGNSTEDQFLKISISDAGGGIYYILETERWAIDDIDELIDILKDFKARL